MLTKIDLKEWETSLRHRKMCVIPGKNEDHNLAVVDSKSFYDHLSKETCGHTSDRRTAIEMQIIRQTLLEAGASIRWIDHNRMIVDPLTKIGGNLEPLLKLLTTGRWSIVAEAQEVELRRQQKALGSGTKENFGGCASYRKSAVRAIGTCRSEGLGSVATVS